MRRFSRIIAGVTATLLLSQAAQTLSAEENRESVTTQTVLEKKKSVGAFPVLFYSDETRIAAGGGAQVMMGGDDERFSSSVGLMAFVTQNRQYTFIIAPELYLKKDAYKMTGSFGYSYFPDSFYGIGNNTDKDNEEKYTGRVCKINPILQKKVRPNLFIGIQYDYVYGKVVKSKYGGQLTSGRVPGSEGGGASGAGINMTWDSRDNNIYPLRGSFHQVIVSSYGSALGSDYTFNSYLVDLRYYRQVFGSHVIAFQGVSCINTGRPSFQYMNEVSSLGKYLRGYTQNQFVDRNVLAFQTEYRMPLYGRFGLVAFAGFGQVAEKLDTIEFDEFKPSVGLGLRFALIPMQKVNMRIDMGMGKDNSSFDISLMETF